VVRLLGYYRLVLVGTDLFINLRCTESADELRVARALVA
jgi:hypothetical protein